VVVSTKAEHWRHQILGVLPALEHQNGVAPTLNEIAEAIGLGRSATYKYLVALREEGKIELLRRFSGWRVTETETETA
jgi:DNA-binding IclR family transcriptional regulator